MRSLGLLTLFAFLCSSPLGASVPVEGAPHVQYIQVEDLNADGLLDDFGDEISREPLPLKELPAERVKLGIPPEAVLAAFEQSRLTAVPPDPGPASEMSFYMKPLPAGVSFGLTHEETLTALGASVKHSAPRMPAGFNTRQYREWLRSEGIHFNDALETDGNLQDFSMNLNAVYDFHPNAEIQVDHFWTQNNVLYSQSSALYDYAGESVYLHYRPFERVKTSAGYELIYREFNGEDVLQSNFAYAPAVSMEYTAFERLGVFEGISLNTYAETWRNRYEEEDGERLDSASRTFGAGLRWNFLGTGFNPGVSIKNETEDLGDPSEEEVVSRYIHFSRQDAFGGSLLTTGLRLSSDIRESEETGQTWEDAKRFSFRTAFDLTQNLSLGSIVAVRTGRQSLVNGKAPRESELSLDLEYRLPGLHETVLLVKCGRSKPFSSAAESRPRSYVNGALIFRF